MMHTSNQVITSLFVVGLCLSVSVCSGLAESAEPPVSDAEQAIRARIVADNKVVAAVRKAVAGKLERASVKQFLNPAAELTFAHKTAAPKGLRAREGFELDIAWRDGKLELATVKSLLGNSCQVRYGDNRRDFEIEAGDSVGLNGELQ